MSYRSRTSQGAAFTPSNLTRAERRARSRDQATALREARTTSDGPRVKDDVLDLPPAPSWGATGQPLWGPAEPHLPAHRASASRWGVATPFLAEAGLGHRGALVGTDLLAGGRFYVDPWELYRARHITGTSMVAIGSVGTGKSTSIKVLGVGLIALGRKIAVASDPKAEWVPVADAVGGKSIRIGPGRPERVNPLDAGVRPSGVSEHEWGMRAMTTRRSLLTSILTLLRHGQTLTEVEHTALELALTRVVSTTRVPVLPDVMAELMEPDSSTRAMIGNAGINLAHALRRMISGDLGGMFDQASTVSFDASLPMIVMDTSDLLTAAPEVSAIASACTNTWLDSALREKSGDFWLVITEEGWAALRDPNMVTRMDERVRLAGEWGIANMLIMHELADLEMVGEANSAQRNQALGLLSKSQIKIIHQQSVTSIDATAAALKLTDHERDLVTDLSQGEALWKIGSHSFLVRTERTEAEARVFDTDQGRAG